ncbi:MAG: SnoaL-like domain [Thermoleophilaceae bacterium]|jgi:ketosteroid isomerase-like protein|nr:SnoaL-like domain [Thermoleophilaceae bacterium]
MGRANEEIAHEGYAAWNHQDLAWLRARVSEDFEFRPAPEFPGLEAVYRGLDGWESFLDHWRQTWDFHRFTIRRIEDLDDQVLVLVVSEGRGKGSGISVEMETAHLWTLRDELVVRGLAYASWQEALEAVGLSE